MEHGLRGDPNHQALRAKQLLNTDTRKRGLTKRGRKKKTKAGWVKHLTGDKTNSSTDDLVKRLINDQVFKHTGTDEYGNDLYKLDKARLEKWIRQTEWYQEFSPMYRDLLDKEFRAVKIPGADLLRNLRPELD